jgi:hypothetical protein
MKSSELKQLIKEEIVSILSEDVKYKSFKKGEKVKSGDFEGEIVGNEARPGLLLYKIKDSKGNIKSIPSTNIDKIDDLSENENYTPGGFMGDEKKPWKSLPAGKYEITYTVLDPLADKRTYMLDLPDGKEFKSYDDATDFYMKKYIEIKNPTTTEDRWRSLRYVDKIN